jgi:hypothetical protein
VFSVGCAGPGDHEDLAAVFSVGCTAARGRVITKTWPRGRREVFGIKESGPDCPIFGEEFSVREDLTTEFRG